MVQRARSKFVAMYPVDAAVRADRVETFSYTSYTMASTIGTSRLLLNRTLPLPPAGLGSNPLHNVAFERLHVHLVLRG